MSPIFIVFLLMLAAFLLLTLAAVVRGLWYVIRHPRSAAANAAKPGGSSTLTDGLLLLGVATAWYSVAMGWGGQFTLYPIYPDLAKVGPEAFNAFGHSYLLHLKILLLPLGVMCLAWVSLLWLAPYNVSRRTVWAIVGLCVAFVASTPFAAGAQDQMLAEGFSESLYAQLMWSNGIRSVLFTGVGLLSLVAIRSRWTTPSNDERGA
jgi:hypothetical protein